MKGVVLGLRCSLSPQKSRRFASAFLLRERNVYPPLLRSCPQGHTAFSYASSRCLPVVASLLPPGTPLMRPRRTREEAAVGGLISLDSNRLVLKNDDNQEIPFYAE